VSGIPLQKGKNPFGKGEKWRCLAGEERRLPFEGKKIPAHMTRAIVWSDRSELSDNKLLKHFSVLFYKVLSFIADGNKS
jgi:hypothetical protein